MVPPRIHQISKVENGSLCLANFWSWNACWIIHFMFVCWMMLVCFDVFYVIINSLFQVWRGRSHVERLSQWRRWWRRRKPWLVFISCIFSFTASQRLVAGHFSCKLFRFFLVWGIIYLYPLLLPLIVI